MIDVKAGEWYVGEEVDENGSRTGTALILDSDDFTTHGIVVGMTGSGKTGLGVIALEEALLGGVPALILDPKGDMGNLMLTFPDPTPGDFAPWVSEDDARREGLTRDEYAAKEAAKWKSGLADWGIDAARMRAFTSGSRLTIYTPGSTAGVPLNIVGSLAAPRLGWEDNEESLRDQIQGFVTGLLALAGLPSDPVSSREHILLANLIEHSWRQGRDLDLASLLTQTQDPPLRKLGVFDTDTFFPPEDRRKMAMRLNGLVASPSFSAWLTGADLDPEHLLYGGDGTAGAIIALAHLTEAERQFVVALVLSRMVTWMRSQSGTSKLRALVYMDEVYGFAPPSAMPPAKKPLMTIMKQGRAYGVGMLLATQNPVDLDYKAFSNAGTWMVGRLQTERDKARVIEGLSSARGDVDVAALDRRLTGLGKRRFLLQSAHRPSPVVFATRWAMSYLRGPLARPDIEALTADRPPAETAVQASEKGAAGGPATAALGVDETLVPPGVAKGTSAGYLDPAAPWMASVGADPRGRRLGAAIVARVEMRFDDRAAHVDHVEEWEAILFPLGAEFRPEDVKAVDYDDRDIRAVAPEGAVYVLPEAPIHQVSFFRGAAKELREHLRRHRRVTVFRNRRLGAYSRVGETRAEFEARLDEIARAKADKEAAKLRDKMAKRMRRLERQIADAQLRREQLEVDARERQREELVAGAGAVLSALFGGRGSTRNIAGRMARSMGTAAGRRSRAARARKRLEAADEKVAGRDEDLVALEQEVMDSVRDIDAKWASAAEEVEEVDIGLELSDIHVDELSLCWIPMARRAPSAADPR